MRSINLVCALAITSALVGGVEARSGEQCSEFSELSMVLEQNATDGDTEVVLFAKGQDDGLKQLTAKALDGRKIAIFRGDSRGIGIREFQLESAEPPELDLVLASFPEGVYSFQGKSVEGDCLSGTASLSHELAPQSQILTPKEDEVVALGEVIVTWVPAPEAVAYIIEVKNKETENALLVDVSAPDTSFDVPATWLEADAEHQIAVDVVTETGNVTNVESAFFTAAE